mgnify:CR=1 FL=1
MNITICIPAYNEEKIIAEAAGIVRAALNNIHGVQGSVVVANNGSTDKTAEQVRRVAGVSVLEVAARGKGWTPKTLSFPYHEVLPEEAPCRVH